MKATDSMKIISRSPSSMVLECFMISKCPLIVSSHTEDPKLSLLLTLSIGLMIILEVTGAKTAILPRTMLQDPGQQLTLSWNKEKLRENNRQDLNNRRPMKEKLRHRDKERDQVVVAKDK